MVGAVRGGGGRGLQAGRRVPRCLRSLTVDSPTTAVGTTPPLTPRVINLSIIHSSLRNHQLKRAIFLDDNCRKGTESAPLMPPVRHASAFRTGGKLISSQINWSPCTCGIVTAKRTLRQVRVKLDEQRYDHVIQGK